MVSSVESDLHEVFRVKPGKDVVWRGIEEHLLLVEWPLFAKHPHQNGRSESDG